jgi:hypothetical protein
MDTREIIIDWLKCSAFVASIFALSTGIVLLTELIERLVS